MSSSSTVRVPSKRLEGVQATDDLRQLVRDVRSLGAPSRRTSEKNSPAAVADGSIYSNLIVYPSVEESVELLRSFDTTNDVVPMAVLRAVEVLCPNDDTSYMKRLDQCLRSTRLAFTPPPPSTPETEERKRFRRRMEQLKLKQEENRYGGLVKNVGVQAPVDDVTTRSMTYAASIGLNMIIAPLSFGCFMYFFAGGLFNYLGWDQDRPAHHGPDIRKVGNRKYIRRVPYARLDGDPQI